MIQANRWRLAALVSAMLFTLCGAIDRLLSGTLATTLVIFIPLNLILLYSLWQRRIRQIQWMGFVLMLMFIASVLRLLSPELQFLRLATLALCVLTFISAIFFIHATRKGSSTDLRSSA